MSVADAPMPLSVAPPGSAAPAPVPPPVLPAAPHRPAAPLPAHVAPWNLASAPGPRPDGLDRGTGRLIAGTFGTAWIVCSTIEPLPSGDVHYPLWQLPIDLAALAAIVAAVVVLWRGGRYGARLGAVAGVLMAVLTIVCPLAGHSTLGWWTWVQTGLSLFVLGTSAALMARAGRRATEARLR